MSEHNVLPHPGLNAGTAVEQRLAEALRLCLAGEADRALRVYRQCLHPDVDLGFRIGLHLHLIDESGRGVAAAGLRAMALRVGCDIAWSAGQRHPNPQAAIEEYEVLFARGFANPRMIDRYLRALAELGRADRGAVFLDVPRLLYRTRLVSPDSDAVADALLAQEAVLEPVERHLSNHGMRELKNLEWRTEPAFVRLIAECQAQSDAFLARWGASDHPMAPFVPAGGRLSAWGLISRGEGYSTRHIHPCGWITGIYYPVGLPASITGGALHIGGWEGHPQMTIRPEAGLLILIPSFYVHWTEPLGAPGLRLAVAFDVQPDVTG